MSYKVEVTTDSDWKNGNYSTNALRFATEAEAKAYGRNLNSRWFAITDWRVAESDDEVTASADGVGTVNHLKGVK